MDGMVCEALVVEAPLCGARGGRAPDERRQQARKACLKRAQVVLDGAGMVDCIVENMSAGGVRVRFGNPVALPAALALRFPDGAAYPARLRWARGAAAGLEFSGEGPAAEVERRHLARAVQDAVSAADPAEALRLLRHVWFFGDDGLRRAADGLEVARARFVAALDPHLAGRAPPPPVQTIRGA